MPWLLPFFFGSDFEPSSHSRTDTFSSPAFLASIRRILVDGTRGLGWPIWGSLAELVTLAAVPIVVVVANYTGSLATVALVVAGANLVALLTIAPALFSMGHYDARFSGRENPRCGPVRT